LLIGCICSEFGESNYFAVEFCHNAAPFEVP